MEELTNFAPVILVVIGALLLISSRGRLGRLLGRRQSPFLERPIVTKNELEFYQRLRRAVPEKVILPQVAMGALIATAPRLGPADRARVRAKFDRKIVDYVIADPHSLEVIALVELDDRTHDVRRDQIRDQITAAAGYRTLRYWSREKPTVGQLRAEILTGQEADQARSRRPA